MGSNESSYPVSTQKPKQNTSTCENLLGAWSSKEQQQTMKDKSEEWLWIPPWNYSMSLCTAEKQPPHNQIWSPLHQTLYSTLCTLQTIVFNRSVEFCGTGLCPLVHHGIYQQPVQQTQSDIHWYKSEV